MTTIVKKTRTENKNRIIDFLWKGSQKEIDG